VVRPPDAILIEPLIQVMSRNYPRPIPGERQYFDGYHTGYEEGQWEYEHPRTWVQRFFGSDPQYEARAELFARLVRDREAYWREHPYTGWSGPPDREPHPNEKPSYSQPTSPPGRVGTADDPVADYDDHPDDEPDPDQHQWHYDREGIDTVDGGPATIVDTETPKHKDEPTHGSGFDHDPNAYVRVSTQGVIGGVDEFNWFAALSNSNARECLIKHPDVSSAPAPTRHRKTSLRRLPLIDIRRPTAGQAQQLSRLASYSQPMAFYRRYAPRRFRRFRTIRRRRFY